MQIIDLVKHKGGSVVTLAPQESIDALLTLLAEHGIGAVVVVDGSRIAGIVSERDIVRALHRDGEAVLRATVSDLMTSAVVSCAPTDGVEEVAATMTERRFRHLPVVDGDRLVGIVSIGDVVAARIRQLEQDRGQLEQYIRQGA